MDQQDLTNESPAPSVKFRIRPASKRDSRQLMELIDPFVNQQKLLPRTPEELEQLLPHGFVAIANRRVVGFASLEIYSKKMAEIRSLCVMAEYQRHGIGHKLVAACVQRARDRHILEVMAISSSDRFFHSCGFDFTLPGEKKAFFLQTRETY